MLQLNIHLRYECTHGLRKGELVTVTAGSGVGKSGFVDTLHSVY